jgi:hypothetical protein
VGKQSEQREPTASDFAEATLYWGQKHGKTAEQILHLRDAEVAEYYRLALDYAFMRRWKETKAQDHA